MRRPRMLDLKCPDCDTQWERLVETNDDGTPIEPQTCGVPLSYEFTNGQVAHERMQHCGGVLAQIASPRAPVVFPGDVFSRCAD